jgi:hypothetical protein
LTELHEALALWAQAVQAAGMRVLGPLVDPSSEPFLPFS